MATLELTYDDIRRHVGRFIGATRTPSSLSTTVSLDVEDALAGGLREFYWPTLPDESGQMHVWSFLRREGTIPLVSGTREYDLPADFSQMMTGLYYPEGAEKKQIGVIPELKQRAILGKTDDEGSPKYAVVRAKTAQTAAFARTRYEVSFYPKPDAIDTVTFTYAFEPPTIDASNDKPLGGAMHSELVLESCLAAAEKIIMPESGEGIHAAKFKELLASSISRDRRLTEFSEDDPSPLDATEGSTSTLEVDREQLKRLVGKSLGFSANPAIWTHGEDSQVEQVIRMGLRDYYWPVLDQKTGKRHFWSFLRNEETIAVLIGTQEYDLPTDFSRLLTNLNYPEASGNAAIGVIKETEMQALIGLEGTTGTALYCSVTSKKSTSAEGSRTTYQVILYPQPDAATTLSFTYAFEPPILTDDNPKPLGGAMHAHLVIQACLSASEKLNGNEGVHTKQFQELLLAAVESDRNLTETEIVESWPKDGVAGSTGDLSINKGELKRIVGWSREYGPNPSSWSHNQDSEVEELVRMGLRQFYNPSVLPGERMPHQWSFMRPVYPLTTVALRYAYDLPSDFAVLNGPITYTPGEAVIYPPIKVTAERYLDNKLQQGEGTGRPLEAALRIKYDEFRTAGDVQVWELLLWPIPNAVYKLNIAYSINAEHLPSTTSLPLGGQPHSQTLVESCLAAAENMAGDAGLHTNKFQQCLLASVGHDREVASPDSMGIYGSYDHQNDGFFGTHGYDEHTTTYNGVTY